MFKLQKILKLFFNSSISSPENGIRKRSGIHSDIHPHSGEDVRRQIYFRLISLFNDDMLFLDPNLNLPQVADILGTNPSYITRAIQMYTDYEGFSDFLNITRVNYAKRLLLEQKKTPVSKIALQCGYNSESNFSANFRKYETTSPGKWRDAHSAASTALK